MTTVDDGVALRKDRLEYSRKSTSVALAILALPLLGYSGSFVAAIALGMPWAIMFAGIEAWCIGMLFIVAHDACHQSFTGSRRLNGIIGRIAMLPALHSFSLWDLGHNRIHHRYNNVRSFDFAWEPMSPADYARAAWPKRATYRFLRSPAGIAVYYMATIWLPKIFLVRKSYYSRYGAFRREYLWDALLVWSFLGFEVLAAALLASLWGGDPLEAIMLAVVLPFLVWNVLISIVIYLHHTHPDVPWYASIEEWRVRQGAVLGTAHVKFPWLMAKLMLNIMEHNAHHFAPGVPLYNLEAMQARVHRDAVVEWHWSPLRFLSVIRDCKLFDYETSTWARFPPAQRNRSAE